MGGAWLTGGLAAIAQSTGWDPASADVIVGTSAGALIGALAGAGVPPWFMVAHSAGEVYDGVLDRSGQPISEADRSGGAVFRLQAPWLPLPGSPSLFLRSLRQGGGTLRSRLAGLAPAGVISTAPIRDLIRRAVPSGWADHPGLWIVACDYASGERTVFGRAGAPPAELGDAVAASCAIPGFYRPVRIGSRRYIDGGLRSLVNLDLLEDAHLDLVLCLSPMSSPRGAGSSARHLPLSWVRAAAGRELAAAADSLRATGTDVLVFEPQGADLEVMGSNFMSRARRHAVIERAQETVGGQVAVAAARLAGLPAGAPDRVRRPRAAPARARVMRETSPR